ncbi:MAG: EAL domain-containing protein [Sulfuricurvum sp.]|nr:EAL domain-containing protein [Sulfuricurvum sp.]MDD5386961.1 EAL domain-containing protein [Sulfuricurvum sp.]
MNTRRQAQQLQNLLKSSKIGIILSLLLGLALIFIQSSVTNPKIVSAWFLLLLLVSLVRITLIILYQRSTEPDTAVMHMHLRNIRIGTLISGMIWGSSGILLFSAHNPEHLIFLIFILAGLSTANTISNAADLVSGIGFLILALSPITIRLFTEETDLYTIMAVALILYITFMIIVMRFIHGSTTKNIIMQFEAEAREKEALEREERYRLILQHTPTGILHYNKDLVVTYCNDRFAQLMKAPKEKLIGLDMKTLKDQSILPALKKAIEGEEGSFEGEYLSTLSNTMIWGIMFYAPLCDTTGTINGGIAIIEDITERKEAEEETKNLLHNLKKSENTLLYLLETSPIAVRIAKAGGQEVIFANNAYARLIQADQSTVLGKNPRNYYANKEEYDAIVMQIDNKKIIYDRLVELSINYQTIWALASYTPIEFEGESCILGWFYDITEQKNLQIKLEQQKEEFETIFNISKDGIAILDMESNFLDFNDAYMEMTGFTREELLATSCIALSIPEDRERAIKIMKTVATEGYVKGFEKTCLVKEGKRIVITMTLTLLPDKKRILISTKDITDMKEHERQLEYIAHYDALTGLPNRILKSDRLRQAMIQAQRREEQVAVLYLDLDGFKEVNDRYGHSIGDQLLVALSARMKQALREGDTLSRLGGDEFVAIIVNMQNTSIALQIIQRLLEAANQPIHLDDLMLQVSASIGVTFYPQHNDVDADQLIRQADQAMYEAKQAGKNRYHIFDPEHDRTIRTRHETLERIHQALKDNEFVLYYQPKINIRTSKLIGAEALIRWNHPKQGLIPPLDFLPFIENHPLAVEIGEWVIDEAISQIERWSKQGLDLPVSINVGARQLLQGDFVERLRVILSRHESFNSSLLEIEVLETSALEDVNRAAHIIEECRTMGIRFALDDFGTGYSSLTYLKRLPVAILKIDQSFVRDMLGNSDDLAILEGIINLASAFHREVIAEGVETLEHGERLLLMGCDLIQGYGIARPMPSEKLLEWSQNWCQDHLWRLES